MDDRDQLQVTITIEGAEHWSAMWMDFASKLRELAHTIERFGGYEIPEGESYNDNDGSVIEFKYHDLEGEE
jgi:hypothetical protein